MNSFQILVVKESRANEKRVGLLPEEVKKLTLKHKVFVEHSAGVGCQATDQDYINAGALIRNTKDYKELFGKIDVVIRVKRAEHKRELEEFEAFNDGLIVIGALDPLESDSVHIQKFKQGKFFGISIDQLKLQRDDPMNILAAMSDITGKLAYIDAVEKHPTKDIQVVMILGYGSASSSALKQALEQNKECFVLVTSQKAQEQVKKLGAHPILIDKQDSIEKMRQAIASFAKKADIVIAAARSSMKKAPILIDKALLNQMKANCVVVDLALSEGGNVEMSKHDETIVTENNVFITNVSGYPKKVAKQASQKWSVASFYAIKALENDIHALDDAKI